MALFRKLFYKKPPDAFLEIARRFRRSVLGLEESAMEVDQVENLIKFCPKKEEIELLKGYNERFEQFFFELMQVPRVESQLRIFSFKIQSKSQRIFNKAHYENIKQMEQEMKKKQQKMATNPSRVALSKQGVCQPHEPTQLTDSKLR